ncbi:hypothetical protein B484DRAFT_478892 [Ochromonadaceae sp. CCMP2298]|nr:hypothetical protein B484DRAFT_478892 [Ochromonadaceae sp. CCMP2298]
MFNLQVLLLALLSCGALTASFQIPLNRNIAKNAIKVDTTVYTYHPRSDPSTSLLSRAVKSFACAASAAALLVGGSSMSWAEDSTPAPAAKPVVVFGLKQGRLLACKAKSNCISTSSVKSVEKYSRPWEFSKEVDEEYEEVLGAIRSLQYLKIAEADKGLHYIHATAKSAFPPSGTDDVEFLLNGADKIITYRSNSREVVGAGNEVVGDGGANRNRLSSIQQKLRLVEMGMSDDLTSYLKSTEQMGFIKKLSVNSNPNEINFVDNSVPEGK